LEALGDNLESLYAFRNVDQHFYMHDVFTVYNWSYNVKNITYIWLVCDECGHVGVLTYVQTATGLNQYTNYRQLT
jgi:hypothetical protein